MPGFPIATTKSGFICFAFPDVCKTPPPNAPIPYPNVGKLQEAKKVSDQSTGTGEVKVGSDFVILAQKLPTEGSEIQTTTGDEPGVTGGVISNVNMKGVYFPKGSATVQIHGRPVVRMFDQTQQNVGGPQAAAMSNANGIVLGGVPNVLVGG